MQVEIDQPALMAHMRSTPQQRLGVKISTDSLPGGIDLPQIIYNKPLAATDV